MTTSVRAEMRARSEARTEITAVQEAIRRANRVLWQSQRADGSWDAMGEMGPTPTAQVLISLRHLGQLSREDALEGAKWLRRQQRHDGSFVAFPFASRGDLGTTALVWAALQLCAPIESAREIEKARAWVQQRGGLPAVIRLLDTGDLSAIYLALAGLIPARDLPCPSIAFLLVGPLVGALETRFHAGVLMVAAQLNLLVRSLRGDFGPDGTSRGFLASAEARAAISLLCTFQNQDGSWNANTLQGALALPALRAAGLQLSDPRVARGLAWLKTQQVRDAAGLRFHAFSSAVWSTAFDLRALFAAGVSPSDPRACKALGWLIDAQLTVPQPRENQRKPGAPRTGGWAFQAGNHTMADSDDAGVVLSALGEALQATGSAAVDPSLALRLRSSIQRGKDWLYGMQNPDGGWSAFVWNLPSKNPGAAMQQAVKAKLDDPLAMLRFLVEPQIALGDPSTEDLTARVLHGLGRIGVTHEAPEVKRAIAFLEAQQCEEGSWWGRWVVNHLAATSFVLMGLRAVGYDMQTAFVRKAVRWVLERQNPDGGWGEGADSYPEPSRAGRGHSMAPLTGLVVQGLLDAGEGHSTQMKKAVRYLLDRQRPDGTWLNDDYLHANVPPDTFYFYPEAARFYPTEALARYARFLEHPPAPVPERWTDAELSAARGRTDPVADKVVSAIFARGQLAAVNDLLGRMFRSDEPISTGLPDEAEAYFHATDQLPTWADREKIKLAQQVFGRAGWEVSIALFCSSLPQAYAAANGAHVLTQTMGMTKHLRQRIFETAQFVFDVLDQGGLEPTGRGIRATQKIRLLHGGIRHLILSRATPVWNSARLGLPINQEDLAGTLLTFSIVTLEGILRMGVEVTAEEQEAWIHLWNCVGSIIGVDEALMARDVNDARLLMDAIRERQWARSTDGRELIRPLVELIEQFIPGEVFDGLPVALIRRLAGEHCADLLGLPPTDWTRLFVDGAGAVEPVLDLAARQLGVAKLFDHARDQIMHAVVAIEREGKQAKFRIPKSLQDTIDPNA